jgi:hypothetical protein
VNHRNKVVQHGQTQVTGRKTTQQRSSDIPAEPDNLPFADSSDIPFAERLFTSAQTQKILQEGKTKFFTKTLPELEYFLDGNKLKITGKSIQVLIEKRLAAPRVPRPMPQLRKAVNASA